MHHHRSHRSHLSMTNFTTGLVGGVALGIIIGTGIALTDSGYRHRMVRDSKRAMHKAGHAIEDMF